MDGTFHFAGEVDGTGADDGFDQPPHARVDDLEVEHRHEQRVDWNLG